MLHPRLATLLLGSALVFACGGKKDDNKDPGAGPGATKDPGGAKGGGAASANADLAKLPADSEAIIGIELAQITSSPLWKAMGPKLMESIAGDFGKLTQMCGFDPLVTIKRISAGIKFRDDMPDGVLVVHGLDKAKTLACVEKAAAEDKDRTELTRDGDTIAVKNKSTSEQVAVTFTADGAAVVTLGTLGTKDGVLAAAAGGSALTSSPAFTELYGKVNTKDAVWILVNGNAKVLDELQNLGIKPKAVFGSVGVADGLTADVRVRVDSADQAAQLAKGFQSQAQAIAGMVDKIEITSDATDIRVAGAASTTKLQALVNLLQGGGR